MLSNLAQSKSGPFFVKLIGGTDSLASNLGVGMTFHIVLNVRGSLNK